MEKELLGSCFLYVHICVFSSREDTSQTEQWISSNKATLTCRTLLQQKFLKTFSKNNQHFSLGDRESSLPFLKKYIRSVTLWFLVVLQARSDVVFTAAKPNKHKWERKYPKLDSVLWTELLISMAEIQSLLLYLMTQRGQLLTRK